MKYLRLICVSVFWDMLNSLFEKELRFMPLLSNNMVLKDFPSLKKLSN